jgi:hypothetical protein
MVGKNGAQPGEEVGYGDRGGSTALGYLEETLKRARNPRALWIVEVEVGQEMDARRELVDPKGSLERVHDISSRGVCH